MELQQIVIRLSVLFTAVNIVIGIVYSYLTGFSVGWGLVITNFILGIVNPGMIFQFTKYASIGLYWTLLSYIFYILFIIYWIPSESK